MIHALGLLLDLLTNEQAVAALFRDVLTFGLTNAGIALFLASFVVVKRMLLRRRGVAPPRTQRFMESRRHSI